MSINNAHNHVIVFYVILYQNDTIDQHLNFYVTNVSSVYKQNQFEKFEFQSRANEKKRRRKNPKL